MGKRKEHSPVHSSGPLTDLPFLEGHQSLWCSEWEIPSATPAPSLRWRTGTEAASPRKQTQLCVDIQQNECSAALTRSSCPWGRKIPTHWGSLEPHAVLMIGIINPSCKSSHGAQLSLRLSTQTSRQPWAEAASKSTFFCHFYPTTYGTSNCLKFWTFREILIVYMQWFLNYFFLFITSSFMKPNLPVLPRKMLSKLLLALTYTFSRKF